MDNPLYRDFGRQDLSGVPNLAPNKNLEFPPLCQLPTEEGSMPLFNPVDQMVPEKYTPVPPGQEDTGDPKDLNLVIPETERILTCVCKQVRHANAITIELKLLLEHEEKILQQVLTRIDKFKNLRDENKRKAIEWENEYKEKVPEYETFSTKLINVPQSQDITVDGLPGPVQQKILFQIVSRTSNTADRVVVSLSMEQTVANDIDLTLGSLKKHCSVMLKRIRGWLRHLKTQECEQNVVLGRCSRFRGLVREMKSKSDAISLATTGSATNLVRHLKPYDDRLKRIEDAVCKMGGPVYGTCPPGAVNPSADRGPPNYQVMPTDSPNSPQPLASQEERLRRIEEALCKMSSTYRTRSPDPVCPPCDDQPYYGPGCSNQQQVDPQEDRLQRIEEAICNMCLKPPVNPSHGSGCARQC